MSVTGGFVRTFGGLLVAGLVVAACGDDGAEVFRGVTTTTLDTPTTTLPETGTGPDGGPEPTAGDLTGFDEEAEIPRIEVVVQDAHALAHELYQVPELAEDPDDPDVARLVELHTSNSPRLDALLTELADLAEEGYRYLPQPLANPGLTVLFDVEPLNVDTVLFQFCTPIDVEVLDWRDEQVDTIAGSLIGDGEARRVGEEWRIHTMEPDPDRKLHQTPGNVLAHECSQHGLENFPTRADREADQGTS